MNFPLKLWILPLLRFPLQTQNFPVKIDIFPSNLDSPKLLDSQIKFQNSFPFLVLKRCLLSTLPLNKHTPLW